MPRGTRFDLGIDTHALKALTQLAVDGNPGDGIGRWSLWTSMDLYPWECVLGSYRGLETASPASAPFCVPCVDTMTSPPEGALWERQAIAGKGGNL